MLDVGAAGIEHGNFIRVGVKSSDFVARFGKAQAQRQADVAAADDSYLELGAFEELRLSFDGHGSSRTPGYLIFQRLSCVRMSVNRTRNLVAKTEDPVLKR